MKLFHCQRQITISIFTSSSYLKIIRKIIRKTVPKFPWIDHFVEEEYRCKQITQLASRGPMTGFFQGLRLFLIIFKQTFGLASFFERRTYTSIDHMQIFKRCYFANHVQQHLQTISFSKSWMCIVNMTDLGSSLTWCPFPRCFVPHPSLWKFGIGSILSACIVSICCKPFRQCGFLYIGFSYHLLQICIF